MRATWRWGGAALCMLLSGWACGSPDESGLGAGGSGPGGSGGAAAAAGAGGASGSAGSGGAHDASLGGASGSGGSGGSAGGAQAVRFVAIGDCGKGNEGQLQVAEAVRAKCADSGCDFVQMLGDNIYDSGANAVDDPQFWTKFEEPYANITVPFWIVLGNHDYGGAGTGFEGWKADVQVAYSQRSNKWRLPARYYGHQEPGVDFYGTDTNAAMFDAHAQQKQDLSSWIQGSTARWKIALGHHPYRSNGPHGNAGSYDNLPFVPIVNGEGVKDLIDSTICGEVDVYISAHDHSLQWMQESCQGTELLISGGGATNTALPGKNPTHYQASKIGFLYVVITDESFTGEFYDATGQLEFARTILKP